MVLAGGPFGLGPLELGLIIIAILLIFGASRVSDLMGGLGKGVKEFKKNVKDDEEDITPPQASAISSGSPPQVSSVRSSDDSIQAIKCPSCQSLNPMNARHCSNCGSALVAPVS